MAYIQNLGSFGVVTSC